MFVETFDNLNIKSQVDEIVASSN